MKTLHQEIMREAAVCSRMKPKPRFTEQERVEKVNALIGVIASVGRRFFWRKHRASHMEVDDRGKVWFIDAYTLKRVYTHYRGHWRGFSNGGTLHCLVEHFREFIKRGKPVSTGAFGPWPAAVCGGDLWGYGESMELVRFYAEYLGVTEPPDNETGTSTNGCSDGANVNRNRDQ